MPNVLLADDTLYDMLSKTMSESGGVEKAVFYLLIAFSLASWSIIFWKIFSFFEARKNGQKFLAVFDGADSFGEAMAHGAGTGQSPVMTVFKAAMLTLENRHGQILTPADARAIKINPAASREEVVELSMRHTGREYFSRLQYGLGFLATAGSATPFIGLFGTVWGILNTFRHIGKQASGDLAGVGSGISSALIATAAGLAVAIPAVIAYNAFLASIDAMQDKTDRFIERVMMLVRTSNCFPEHAPMPRHAPLMAVPSASPISVAPLPTPAALPTHAQPAPVQIRTQAPAATPNPS